MNRIIDISQFNTITDWNLVQSNADAIIIRMGFTYSINGYLCVDNNYVTNRKMCEKLGIPHSFYFFTNAITEEEAVREAEFVAHECKGITSYCLPVFVDSEKVSGTGRADNLSKEVRTKCLNAFCSTLQKNGVPAGIYCNYSWLNDNIDINKLPYSLWLAQWADKPSYNNYVIWQYTSKGTIPGIAGNVDMSTDKHESQSNVDKIIDLAEQELGYYEKASGDLSMLYDKLRNIGTANYTKYNYEMHKIQPKNMDYPAAWCQAFISWLFVTTFGLKEAKRMLCGDIEDYTVQAASYFIAANRWIKTNPQRGDIVFFADGGGINHVGLVTRVDATNFSTIEGNSGNKVARHNYPLNSPKVAGFGIPLY